MKSNSKIEKVSNKSRKPIHKGSNKPKNLHKAWRCKGNGSLHEACKEYESFGGYISNNGRAKLNED